MRSSRVHTVVFGMTLAVTLVHDNPVVLGDDSRALSTAESDFDLPIPLPPGPAAELDANYPPLELILKKMAQVSVLYADKSLSFTAEEFTTVTTRNRHKYSAPTSVYCYYDAGRGRVDDRRIEKAQLARFRKQLKRHEDITEDLTNAHDPLRHNSAVPFYVLRPYGWILLFSHEAQTRYRYRIERSKKKGILLSFEPDVPEPSAADWYGTVLVDPRTFQILRAEGQQHENVEEHRRLKEMLESGDRVPSNQSDRVFLEAQIRVDFDYTAHGIRLPTKVVSTIYHHVVTQPVDKKYSKKRLAYRVVQRYTNYEFYDVIVTDTIDRQPESNR